MSVATQKPKLTGWAAAAAKAVPKPSPSPLAPANSGSLNANTTISSSTTNYNTTSASKTTTQPLRELSKKSKKPGRPLFNRLEVRDYLQNLFDQQSTLPNTTTYTSVKDKNSLDWGTTSSNRWKNKKYSCLNDIAKVLRN